MSRSVSGGLLLGSSGSGSRCRKSLMRVSWYVASSFLWVDDSLVKASAVRVAGFDFSFCERDAFDLGGRMGSV